MNLFSVRYNSWNEKAKGELSRNIWARRGLQPGLPVLKTTEKSDQSRFKAVIVPGDALA